MKNWTTLAAAALVCILLGLVLYLAIHRPARIAPSSGSASAQQGHSSGNRKPQSFRWSYHADGAIRSTPAIGPDDTVYISTYQILYAFEPNGTLKWKHVPGYSMTASPVVTAGGDIIIVGGCNLHRLNASGSVIWANELGESAPGKANENADISLEGVCSLRATPALHHDDVLVVGNSFGSIFTVNAATGGSINRFYGLSGSVYSSPVIAPGGNVVANEHKNVTSFDLSGRIQWKTRTTYSPHNSPAITGSGMIVTAAGDHKLHALDFGGGPLWEVAGDFTTSPVISNQGVVYVANDKAVHAIGPDGKEIWKVEIPRSHGIAIADDGTLYTGGKKGDQYCLWALNPDGTVKWSLPVDGPVQQSPAIGSDGTVYCGTNIDGNNVAGTIYAVREENGGLARGGWPKIYGTKANDGNVPAP
jgi:hypothetical protein